MFQCAVEVVLSVAALQQIMQLLCHAAHVGKEGLSRACSVILVTVQAHGQWKQALCVLVPILIILKAQR